MAEHRSDGPAAVERSVPLLFGDAVKQRLHQRILFSVFFAIVHKKKNDPVRADVNGETVRRGTPLRIMYFS